MTDSSIKFSLGIPLGVIEPAGEFQSQEAAAQMGQTLESAGVAASYVTDHLAPVATWLHANGHDATDPFTSLSFVAAVTSVLSHTPGARLQARTFGNPGGGNARPALLYKISKRLKRERTDCNAALNCSASVTSAFAKPARPPFCSIRLTVSSPI